MERLTKRRLQLDTVEAYACICAYATCSCSCDTCYCLCDLPYNPTVSVRNNAYNNNIEGAKKKHQLKPRINSKLTVVSNPQY